MAAGRPELYTSYEADTALLNTPGKRLGVGLLILLGACGPFVFADDILSLLAQGFAAAIGVIGLNLVIGYAGQVSLGHAFFLGLGAVTAAVLNGDPDGRLAGYGLDMVVWLPAAGIVAAVAGLLISPAAVRLRGLYLAIVTVGVVFLGEHIFKEANHWTGGPSIGRDAPEASLFGYRFDEAGPLLGLEFTKTQKLYLLAFALLVVAAVTGRNLARSKIGRAFAAVRDRDIAAEAIGVSLVRTKALAFAISSFYAGVAGAVLYTIIGTVEPTNFNLLLSVQFVAMVLIGGAGTISGSIMGAVFITLLPRIVTDVTNASEPLENVLTGGGALTVFELQQILYGVLIVVFLVFEPGGLYGLWVRFRNYWKGWPFSY